ncbi:cytochrome c oxidase assembly protein [Azospirillum doebereinerae]|uniref:Cytochrome c oxidase assembly protein CtaG n=1 Tax=Azospirillum doebereinerae TaxID=92933 RepID=A0A3S0V4U1_9PROT|nr:cytochrome c oxidase assembly protein [Azospirillum doebereinerae]MCG5239744.1 cytochrome c oxidase assembly protein [Azospirillum doebereinerae]RUQ67137.1 cytochrome c oxidase assembly protein [Azospirillum doebereinerae]
MKQDLRRRNLVILSSLFGLVFGMIGLAYASVPLYSLFCSVTGFGGTTQRAQEAASHTVDRKVTIRFNADTNMGLPWAFKPEQKDMVLKLGETGLAAYRAENKSAKPTVGTAVYNVTPDKVGQYFNKIECFCFTEQVLQPGQAVDMPVAFFVDPAMNDDPNMQDVTTITLSYTFFRAKDSDAVLAQQGSNQKAAPSATATN